MALGLFHEFHRYCLEQHGCKYSLCERIENVCTGPSREALLLLQFIPLLNMCHTNILTFGCWPAVLPSALIGSIWLFQLAGDTIWQGSQELNKRFSNIKARGKTSAFIRKVVCASILLPWALLLLTCWVLWRKGHP